MDNDQNPQQTTRPLVGMQLQQARENAGLSVSEVANVQHLRSCIIQAIEEGEYSKIDTELFLKGYIRAYAKQVGLNPDDVISDLEIELEPLRQKKEQELEANPLVTIERRRRQKRRVGKLFLLLAAVVLIGYLIFTFGLGSFTEVTTQSSLTSGQPETSLSDSSVNSVSDEYEIVSQTDLAPAAFDAPDTPEATVRQDPIAAVVESQAEPELASEVEIETESGISAPVVVESVEQALAEPGEPLAIPGTGILQITFIDDCWIQVRDATGDKLINSLQREGDRIDISGETPLRVVIGAVDAVGSIRFQGEAVNMNDYRVVNNRSEFTLTI
jgi:cytoskeleton protein RodZ